MSCLSVQLEFVQTRGSVVPINIRACLTPTASVAAVIRCSEPCLVTFGVRRLVLFLFAIFDTTQLSSSSFCRQQYVYLIPIPTIQNNVSTTQHCCIETLLNLHSRTPWKFHEGCGHATKVYKNRGGDHYHHLPVREAASLSIVCLTAAVAGITYSATAAHDIITMNSPHCGRSL